MRLIKSFTEKIAKLYNQTIFLIAGTKTLDSNIQLRQSPSTHTNGTSRACELENPFQDRIEQLEELLLKDNAQVLRVTYHFLRRYSLHEQSFSLSVTFEQYYKKITNDQMILFPIHEELSAIRFPGLKNGKNETN